MAHKFLRDDGWFQFPALADVTTTATSTGTLLSFISATLSSSTQIGTTPTTLASASQGSSGVWFATAGVTAQSSATTMSAAFALTDGSNIYSSCLAVIGISANFPVCLSGVASAPAGNLRIIAQVSSGTCTALTSGSAFNNLTYINVIRIG